MAAIPGTIRAVKPPQVATAAILGWLGYDPSFADGAQALVLAHMARTQKSGRGRKRAAEVDLPGPDAVYDSDTASESSVRSKGKGRARRQLAAAGPTTVPVATPVATPVPATPPPAAAPLPATPPPAA